MAAAARWTAPRIAPCARCISGRDGPELLELGEEVLDQVAFFVDVTVVIPLDLPVGLGRDHGRFASLHAGEQVVAPCKVVSLASGQEEADRVAQRVHHRVYLRAQATAGEPDRLVLAGALAGAVRANFFGAPALCWWARTTVLSIIAYALSASAAK